MTKAEKIRIMLKLGHRSGAIARFLKCDTSYVCGVRWRDQQPLVDGLSYKAFCMRKTRSDPEYRARERAQHAEYKRRRKAQALRAAA